MAKYRKKPVVIDAIQFTGDNLAECIAFIKQPVTLVEGNLSKPHKLFIDTLEGSMEASIGDFIIKGVNGEFYPCKPDIFEKTYEKVEEKKTFSYSVDDIIKSETDIELPIPLSVIPNYMGINLVSVDRIEWSELKDGQLVSLNIIFKPGGK